MPPKGKPLSPSEIALLKTWIAEGASWPAGLTFKRDAYVPPLKPRRLTLPPAGPGLEHPIDRIVGAYYREHRVTPPRPLDDVAFIRRAYLDLVGLLPPVAELDVFLHGARAKSAVC